MNWERYAGMDLNNQVLMGALGIFLVVFLGLLGLSVSESYNVVSFVLTE